jgi:hypothetical protein
MGGWTYCCTLAVQPIRSWGKQDRECSCITNSFTISYILVDVNVCMWYMCLLLLLVVVLLLPAAAHLRLDVAVQQLHVVKVLHTCSHLHQHLHAYSGGTQTRRGSVTAVRHREGCGI